MNEGSYPQQPRPITLADGAHRDAPEIVANRPQTQFGDAPTPPVLPSHGPARAISIEPVHHGFVVSVGCQKFAIESVDALLHRLNVYLKDPIETEKKWMAGEWKW